MQEAEATDREEDTLGRRRELRPVLRGVLPGDRVSHVLDGRPVRLGRSGDCDLVLDRDRVSRLHAEVYVQGPVVALRDLGSTNGSFVDGRRVQHAVLKPGCVVRLGEWLGMVETVRDDAREQPFAELVPGVYGGTAMSAVVDTLRRVASSDIAVSLVGATGSGKERLARALHGQSGREGAFHAINCAALPPELAEGELFGYRRGAFTGALQAHAGHLRAAHRGTLFLDEVAELSLAVQAKLLRVLEEKQVMALGETKSAPIDVRLVSACQVPLAELCARGVFRDDLRARLAGLTLGVPLLRERRADVPSLFLHFLRAHTRGAPPAVSTKLYEALCLHDWPLNVRELESLSRLLVALHADQARLRRSHLPDEFPRPDSSAPDAGATFGTRRAQDLDRLKRALEGTRGNVKRAAELVGISRQRAHRLLTTLASDEGNSEPAGE